MRERGTGRCHSGQASTVAGCNGQAGQGVVGVEVVGRATDGEDAVALIDEHRPDLFIAGIDPTVTGQLDCIRRASERPPGLRSVVLADITDVEAVEAAFAAGACVYCVKTAVQDDLASAIRQAFERSIYLATSVATEFTPRPKAIEPRPTLTT